MHKRSVRVEYKEVDGAHFFTSKDVPGLCAASKDLATAYNSVGHQLRRLVRSDSGEQLNFTPALSVDEFIEHVESTRPARKIPEITNAAIMQWAMTTSQ